LIVKEVPEYYQLVLDILMSDLICDVINYCASSFSTGKIKCACMIKL